MYMYVKPLHVKLLPGAYLPLIQHGVVPRAITNFCNSDEGGPKVTLNSVKKEKSQNRIQKKFKKKTCITLRCEVAYLHYLVWLNVFCRKLCLSSKCWPVVSQDHALLGLVWSFAELTCFACQLCENLQFALSAIYTCSMLLLLHVLHFHW